MEAGDPDFSELRENLESLSRVAIGDGGPELSDLLEELQEMSNAELLEDARHCGIPTVLFEGGANCDLVSDRVRAVLIDKIVSSLSSVSAMMNKAKNSESESGDSCPPSARSSSSFTMGLPHRSLPWYEDCLPSPSSKLCRSSSWPSIDPFRLPSPPSTHQRNFSRLQPLEPYFPEPALEESIRVEILAISGEPVLRSRCFRSFTVRDVLKKLDPPKGHTAVLLQKTEAQGDDGALRDLEASLESLVSHPVDLLQLTVVWQPWLQRGEIVSVVHSFRPRPDSEMEDELETGLQGKVVKSFKPDFTHKATACDGDRFSEGDALICFSGRNVWVSRLCMSCLARIDCELEVKAEQNSEEKITLL